MPNATTTQTAVWDLPTRIFHWSLVLLIATNLFVVEPSGGMATVVHLVVGYLVAGLVVFRLAWGFIGSPRSRFADFVHRWPSVQAYLRRLVRLDPPHSVGHNAPGGWMILALLAAVIVMVATGLCASSRHAAGPLAHFFPVGWTAILGSVHELVSNLLIGLVVVHIAGVVVERLLTGDNLVAAMWHGRKRLPAAEAAAERPLAPLWRAALVAVMAGAITALLVAASDFSANRESLRQMGSVEAVP